MWELHAVSNIYEQSERTSPTTLKRQVKTYCIDVGWKRERSREITRKSGKLETAEVHGLQSELRFVQ
eukprot:scaffold2574_cov98-Cylindrotheca_fusiformis.AAC.10